MLHLAFSGIFHFSFAPLRFSLYAGMLTLLASLGALLCAGYRFFVLKAVVSDMTLLLSAIFFLGGVQLLAIGVLGSYLARNYDEARPRPLYVIRSKEGF